MNMLNMLHRSIKLVDGLVCYIWQGRGNNANTYLFANVLRGDRPHVIVDPGFTVNEVGERCFDSLTAVMQQDGFNMEDIGLIINTHTHPDHCQAARRQKVNCANQRRYYAIRKSEREVEVKKLAVVYEWRETIHNKCAPGACEYYAQCEAIVMTGAAIPCIPYMITPRPRADGMQDRSIVARARMVEATA
jgi:glyoxylase-like metal-dependent hydrolase (beta-lactamase superfamily II)